MNIEKYFRDGTVSIRMLRKVTGLKRAGIIMRFKRGTPFRENEIDALRVMFWPLFQELYPEFIIVNLNQRENNHD